jgi:hypothetical protein
MTDGETEAGTAAERAAQDRQSAARETQETATRGSPAEGHPVQDAYVARRLAREAAARAADPQATEGSEDATEDSLHDSPAGFYLALGVIVAALLLTVIWVYGTQRQLPATVVPRPSAPPRASILPAPGRPRRGRAFEALPPSLAMPPPAQSERSGVPSANTTDASRPGAPSGGTPDGINPAPPPVGLSHGPLTDRSARPPPVPGSGTPERP